MEPRFCGDRALETAGLSLLREPAAGLELEFVVLWSFDWESTKSTLFLGIQKDWERERQLPGVSLHGQCARVHLVGG